MIQPIDDTYAKTTVYTCISQSSKIQKVFSKKYITIKLKNLTGTSSLVT